MEDIKKVNEQELKQIQDLTSNISFFKSEIANLELKKSQVMGMFFQYDADLKKLMGTLREAYGDIVVNVETGEYKLNEPPAEPVDETKD